MRCVETEGAVVEHLAQVPLRVDNADGRVPELRVELVAWRARVNLNVRALTQLRGLRFHDGGEQDCEDADYQFPFHCCLIV